MNDYPPKLCAVLYRLRGSDIPRVAVLYGRAVAWRTQLLPEVQLHPTVTLVEGEFSKRAVSDLSEVRIGAADVTIHIRNVQERHVDPGADADIIGIDHSNGHFDKEHEWNSEPAAARAAASSSAGAMSAVSAADTSPPPPAGSSPATAPEPPAPSLPRQVDNRLTTQQSEPTMALPLEDDMPALALSHAIPEVFREHLSLAVAARAEDERKDQERRTAVKAGEERSFRAAVIALLPDPAMAPYLSAFEADHHCPGRDGRQCILRWLLVIPGSLYGILFEQRLLGGKDTGFSITPQRQAEDGSYRAMYANVGTVQVALLYLADRLAEEDRRPEAEA